MYVLIFFPKIRQKMEFFLLKLLLVVDKNWIITLIFEKKTPIFHRKLAKIAENCNHDIQPRSDVLLLLLLFRSAAFTEWIGL
jgi:hypothetical protein